MVKQKTKLKSEYKTVMAVVPKSVYSAFKVRAVELEISMREAATQAFAMWLKQSRS